MTRDKTERLLSTRQWEKLEEFLKEMIGVASGKHMKSRNGPTRAPQKSKT